MRIRNEDELKSFKNMSEHARKQLEGALKSSGTDFPHGKDVYAGLQRSAQADRDKREARSDYALLPEFDPDPDPAAVLLRACIKRWGHGFANNPKPGTYNDVLSELNIKGRKFRIDVALCRHKIAVEFDGWSNHFRKKAMQNDHEKTQFLGTHGWLVIRTGKKQVQDSLTSLLNTLDDIRATRPSGVWVAEYVNATSFYTRLKSWNPLACESKSIFNYT